VEYERVHGFRKTKIDYGIPRTTLQGYVAKGDEILTLGNTRPHERRIHVMKAKHPEVRHNYGTMNLDGNSIEANDPGQKKKERESSNIMDLCGSEKHSPTRFPTSLFYF